MKKNNSKIQFLWEGKEEALLQHLTPPSCTYEQPNDIQGNEIHCVDNLDFLKLNQERLRGKVKCIYIDPPYNTGRDFIYKDKRHGRGECKHSNWLSFMYPRLVLARELLREDGVIFISIDDNEVHHLRQIMNEVFGEGEFVSEAVWRKTDNQPNIGNIARVKEYILSYSKDHDSFKFGKMQLTERAKKEYRYSDSNGDFRRSILLDKTRGRHFYEISTPTGKILNGPWMIKKEEFGLMDTNDEIYWTKGGDEQPYGKIYLHKSEGQIPNDFLGIEYGTNQEGSLEVEELFKTRIFDFPKPVSLIKHLLQISTSPSDLILDFFAGSGTTGQAVMELNQEEIDKQTKDGLLADKTAEAGGRKFILVQLPEKIDEKKEAFKAGYRHISDITIERVRRAGAKYKGDVGFKVFDCIKKTELLEKYQ